MSALLKGIGTSLLLVLVCQSATAQVATAPAANEKFVRSITFSGADQAVNTTDRLFEVPPNRGLRVTDLIVTNFRTGNCEVLFPGKTTEMFVAPNSTLVVNFLSGPTYKSGEELSFGNDERLPGFSTECELTYTVMGYTFSLP